eukprot:CAMPEP_0116020400 /NCGR_PEP_ID=MMETSP0321-20121206/9772_1 /TAXON_ID=163516 /ORGANISM="Leptocylindrus danicus var. danicus, Strain B650" /LENGTH=509 /DNA_ID=CAMNT_0003491079 /DNA_START=354 /DNA_END=1884 /DNA_ORIENTATION=-
MNMNDGNNVYCILISQSCSVKYDEHHAIVFSTLTDDFDFACYFFITVIELSTSYCTETNDGLKTKQQFFKVIKGVMKALTLLLVFVFVPRIRSTVVQCHEDCRAPASLRTLGPTRPNSPLDSLGNKLSVTHSYPHTIAATVVNATVLEFNTTLRVYTRHNVTNNISAGDIVRSNVVDAMKDVMREFLTGRAVVVAESDLMHLNVSLTDAAVSSSNLDQYTYFVDFVVASQVVMEFNGYYSVNLAQKFLDERLIPAIREKFDPPGSKIEKSSSYLDDAIISLPPPPYNINDTAIIVFRRMEPIHPNPYSKFCELGCSMFYSPSKKSKTKPTSQNKTTTLSSCHDECEEMYEYNISVGYNDLVEVARLECRDGCQIALKRCQPGYYCLQPEPATENGVILSGGTMNECPAGTYRPLDYDAVTQCIPCPPGRFREATKGKSLDSCSKCPPSTYNEKFGATSMLDCVRCPAGTFMEEKGASKCLCITPASCKDEYDSPADAEKRDTVPYIGRW